MNSQFPEYRPRRMRSSEALRRLLCETRFSPNQLIMPYFVREGRKVKEPINAMPGQFRFSPDTLSAAVEPLVRSGVKSILLFGIAEAKDAKAGASASKNGVVQKAIREIKKRFPDLLVMTDVCLCAYTSHGHCGLLNVQNRIDNDATLPVLARMALSHADAGADMISPSDMMDGRIRAIRQMLDQKGFENLPVMSYAAKYSSSFYGPFREAAHSAPGSSKRQISKMITRTGALTTAPKDRKTYQMNPANREEALREIALDIQEGADIVMVKPALAYLDILREAKDMFHFPLAAYMVSGEYAMIKAAAEKGWIDERSAVLESLVSIFRAGANTVITYHAQAAAGWLENN